MRASSPCVCSLICDDSASLPKTALYATALYATALHATAPHATALHATALHAVVMFLSLLHVVDETDQWKCGA